VVDFSLLRIVGFSTARYVWYGMGITELYKLLILKLKLFKGIFRGATALARLIRGIVDRGVDVGFGGANSCSPNLVLGVGIFLGNT